MEKNPGCGTETLFRQGWSKTDLIIFNTSQSLFRYFLRKLTLHIRQKRYRDEFVTALVFQSRWAQFNYPQKVDNGLYVNQHLLKDEKSLTIVNGLTFFVQDFASLRRQGTKSEEGFCSTSLPTFAALVRRTRRSDLLPISLLVFALGCIIFCSTRGLAYSC